MRRLGLLSAGLLVHSACGSAHFAEPQPMFGATDFEEVETVEQHTRRLRLEQGFLREEVAKLVDATRTRLQELEAIDAKIVIDKSEEGRVNAEIVEQDQVRRAIETKIDLARQDMGLAVAEVRQSRCAARAAKLDAETETMRAQCLHRMAIYAQCLANNSKSDADNTLVGALIAAVVGASRAEWSCSAAYLGGFPAPVGRHVARR